MGQEYDVKGMTRKIAALKKTAIELKALSQGIPAVSCNADRILTNVRILEISVTEAAEILKD
jgi:hypothetical protein